MLNKPRRVGRTAQRRGCFPFAVLCWHPLVTLGTGALRVGIPVLGPLPAVVGLAAGGAHPHPTLVH